ncbi:MAG: hypothetical protein JWO80_2243 [Bryobacterales bacterium]|nr:hypothetical protein [Bryobacterales bacterium]
MKITCIVVFFAALFLETPLLHADFSYYYTGAPFTSFIGPPIFGHIDAMLFLLRL